MAVQGRVGGVDLGSISMWVWLTSGIEQSADESGGSRVGREAEYSRWSLTAASGEEKPGVPGAGKGAVSSDPIGPRSFENPKSCRLAPPRKCTQMYHLGCRFSGFILWNPKAHLWMFMNLRDCRFEKKVTTDVICHSQVRDELKKMT